MKRVFNAVFYLCKIPSLIQSFFADLGRLLEKAIEPGTDGGDSA